MKAVLVGSVAFSREMLEVLVSQRSAQLELVAVFAVSPEYSKNISDYADLAAMAKKANVPCYAFHKINSPEVIERFRDIRPDYTFIFGLSQLLPGELISAAGLVIGTHPTLLPDGRGRAAVPWSILLGWKRSGISFFGITEGVDEGLIYEQEPWDIGPTDDAESLYGKMCAAGKAAFKRLLGKIASGQLVGTPQGTPRIGPLGKRRREDGKVDFSMTAEDAERLVRATTRPYPGAFIELAAGWPSARLILWKSGGVVTGCGGESGTVIDSGGEGLIIAFANGGVRITEAEFEGSGLRLAAGDDFSKYFEKGRRLA